MKQKWNEMTPAMKLLRIAGFAAAGVILVSAVLQLTHTISRGDRIYIPALAVLTLIQTAENWQADRKTAYVSLTACIIITVLLLLSVARGYF